MCVAILWLITWAFLTPLRNEEVTALSNTSIVIVRQYDPGALRDLILLCRNGRAQPHNAVSGYASSGHAGRAAGDLTAECTEVE